MNDPRTQFSDTYDQTIETPFSQNHSSRLSQNDGTCSSTSDQEFLQFRPIFHHQELMESDDSGICSPPLWKNTPSPSQPLLSIHHVHWNLSPDSRLQAITRGQRDLMEMVKTMPESSYELSLKDLVEHHKIETQNPQPSNRNLHQRAVVKVKRQESKKNEKNLTRVESFEYNGLLLKMVFPFSLKSKKKDSASYSSGKVSPKAEAAKGGGSERDWWKKKFTGSSDSSRTSNNSGSSTGSSDSSRTSNNSGSSGSGRSDGGGGRKNKGLLRGCWLFSQFRWSKSVE